MTVLLFDGPPLLPTPQTQVLNNSVGQVVVEEALDMSSEEQATGLVMNKSEGISDVAVIIMNFTAKNKKDLIRGII